MQEETTVAEEAPAESPSLADAYHSLEIHNQLGRSSFGELNRLLKSGCRPADENELRRIISRCGCEKIGPRDQKPLVENASLWKLVR